MRGVLLIGAAGTTVLTAQDDEIVELSPFTVDASSEDGYRATQTLSGTASRAT